MKEKVQMSIKEADRLGIMRQMDVGKLNLKQAGQAMQVCMKQARRIRKRYLTQGPSGLISCRRGRVSNRRKPDSIRQAVVNLLKTTYAGFGPTLAAEKLKELNALVLSEETIRQWMMQEGLWSLKRRKECRVYQSRQRRSCFGELIQGDGSPYDWFEGRGPKCTLLQFVDDATSKITAARFVPVESTEGYLKILKEHLKKYGRPLAFYVDKHSIFRVNQKDLTHSSGITHFGRVCKELGIEVICAHSPQAKGRVERKNGVLQDRLIKEMRLRRISSIEEGNAYLPTFIEDLNRRFAVDAAEREDAHRALRSSDNLDIIFARREERKLSKNLTFQYEGVLYLINTKTPNRLKHATVDIVHINGEPIQVRHGENVLAYKAWQDVNDERAVILSRKEIAVGALPPRKRRTPAKHHPWR